MCVLLHIRALEIHAFLALMTSFTFSVEKASSHAFKGHYVYMLTNSVAWFVPQILPRRPRRGGSASDSVRMELMAAH